ncbi:MAG: D-glycero-beta-D-manno-heptose-7-phosphate kinase [Bacteriovoracia bacterium]
MKSLPKYQLTRPRFEKTVSQFSRKKVLVFGDVGVDKYTIGRVTRISPEAPIPVVQVTDTQLKLGLAANVADNIQALGADPLLVGLVGDDRNAMDFSGLLRSRRVSDKYIVTDGSRRTTLKERVVAESQQVVRIDYETQEKIESEVAQEIWYQLSRAIDQSDAVVIEDYAKGLVSPSICRQIIHKCEQNQIPVFVDPNGAGHLSTYFGCTILTPNTAEAELLSHVKIIDHESLTVAGLRILEKVNAQIVIITRGKEGMAIFIRSEPYPLFVPTFAREVFDVSGAGDTVIATLALCLVSGANIVEAALIANFAAGIEVGKRGTATVTVSELREYIDFIGYQNAKISTGKQKKSLARRTANA